MPIGIDSRRDALHRRQLTPGEQKLLAKLVEADRKLHRSAEQARHAVVDEITRLARDGVTQKDLWDATWAGDLATQQGFMTRVRSSLRERGKPADLSYAGEVEQ